MASTDEIASSLMMDEIPVKLRCAACNKLAVNAFRMPCCDQSICETCQSSLPQACPVCLHEPVKADDCRPNKALRTTIKVFLRKKGIERDAAHKKESLDQPVTSSAVSANSLGKKAEESSISQISTIPGPEIGEVAWVGPAASSGTSNKVEKEHGLQISPAENEMDVVRSSIESVNHEIPSQGLYEHAVNAEGRQEQKEVERHEEISNPNGVWGANTGPGALLSNNGIGLEGMTTGFPSMDFARTGDFSQMMQFMPNGMQSTGMGSFPNMMMMPGMGMDQMAMSQGMYGGLGSQSMGMNGMNVGMGFNTGQGVFGGFNGQPAAWNAGQDKFNPNAYVGHSTGMGGDFGGNTGYGGYNMPQHQGNFNQIHHQYQNNDFQNGYNGQGFHNRGRGRGRGYHNAGRGRGGHNQVNAGNHSNYEPFHHQLPQPPAKPDSVHQQVMPAADKAHYISQHVVEDAEKAPIASIETDSEANEKLIKELEPGDMNDASDTNITAPLVDSLLEDRNVPKGEPLTATLTTDGLPKPGSGSRSKFLLLSEVAPTSGKPDQITPIETLISDDVEQLNPDIPNGTDAHAAEMPSPTQLIPPGPAVQYLGDSAQEYGSRGRVPGRAPFRGRSEHRGAMRGRGSSINSNLNIAPASPVPLAAPEKVIITLTPTEPKGLGVEGAPKAPKALREGLPNTGIRGGRGFSIIGRAANGPQTRVNGHARSRSPSPARSQSRSRHLSNRHRSHRHRSVGSSNGSEREIRRDHQRRHSHKYSDEDHDRSHNINGSHTREQSPEELARRSSHRDHRDRTKEKDGGRSSHRSHRSHRDRSRGRDGPSHGVRRRSRSAEDRASRPKRADENQPTSPIESRRKEKPGEPSQSLRKRRDRDREEEERHHERKRSRRARSSEAANEQENSNNRRALRHAKRDEREQQKQALAAASSSRIPPNRATEEKPTPKAAPLNKPPEMDPHTLEREARNRERLLKELQRREAMEGKGASAGGQQRREGGKADGGRVGGMASSRRMSYKYEDEESNEARASRVENEREAGRWR